MKSTNILYQYGTLALLVPGLFEGTLQLKDLLKHGDTGIGTGDGLDGELIVKDGVAYKVDGNGDIKKLDGDFTVPFADVHFADYQPLVSVKETITPDNLESTILSRKKWSNVFFSIRAHGTFSQVTTRSINRQEKPYPPLVDCARNQHEFHADRITGTILGYYSPQLFNGAAVGGLHLHFIADDLSIGGHLLDFAMQDGEIAVQKFDQLEQKFPTQSDDFMQHDFSKDDIAGAIGEAE